MEKELLIKKFQELVWLNYQSSKELAEFVKEKDFMEIIPLNQWAPINEIAQTTFIKFERLKDSFDKEVNIVELAKKVYSNNI